MLKSNSKSMRNHVVSPEEEKERLQLEGFAEKEGVKSGMKDSVMAAYDFGYFTRVYNTHRPRYARHR